MAATAYPPGMDMSKLPQLLAAMAFFGAIFVCPLVYLLLRHQRMMAEFIHRSGNNETLQRLAAMEQELHQLRAAHNELVLREEDQRVLRQRMGDGT
jgi:hypothetical protein